MRLKNLTLSLLLPLAMTAQNPVAEHAGCGGKCMADSVDMLAYSNAEGTSGLRLAWRADGASDWKLIGPNYNFVSSDFGPWGSHKKMFSPILTRNSDGSWTASWIADPNDPVLAVVSSPDLKQWHPQHYEMTASRDRKVDEFTIDGKKVKGNIIRVPRMLVSDLGLFTMQRNGLGRLYGERMHQDSVRFAGLEVPTYVIEANPDEAYPISDKLMGIFFEDINYAADGGLYAELIQNRDFEYSPADRGGDKDWNSMTAWSFEGNGKYSDVIAVENPIHANNPHYLKLTVEKPGISLLNSGFDGIPVKAKETYDLSLRLRAPKGAKLNVSLVDNSGKTLCSTSVTSKTDGEWQTLDGMLVSKNSCKDAKLKITPQKAGTYDIDLVSLFPRNTFKGRKNGLRQDLAQTLADLKPQFVRFPGGCVAHGNGVDNIYDWKGSVGPLEARKPLRNLWGYHQTRGLGYHEYFLFCEDIDAEPLPVLAAGVPCQNSGDKAHHSHDALTTRGQQCGIPMEEMDAYIQDVLDLIEYANGDVNTEWGAKRAAAGHPEPFNLKYLGIGNEDMITEVFVPRFKMIYDAVQKAHPEITVVGTVGPFYEGTDYEEGWKLARELNIPIVDEHYYVSPGWLIYNQDYYDDYRRNATKVYLGEYASHRPDRKSTIETALTEAIYLASVERNGDVVEMTSYAPLLAKDNHTQWTPDLIYFNNNEIRPTVDYYVQQLYGQNAGDTYIPAKTYMPEWTASDKDYSKAKARLGSSIVRDDATGDYIVKIANLLPVEVPVLVNLDAVEGIADGEVDGWVLSGHYDDASARPEAAKARVVDGKLSRRMPAYSFTVLRVPSKK